MEGCVSFIMMKTKDIVNISMFATLLAVCAWICIPTVVPFTMQTFAVFLAMLVLGGKKGTIVICIYLFLGIIGVPVFSRGTAGIGVLFGGTGGYMIGWIFIGMVMCAAERLVTYQVRKKMNSDSDIGILMKNKKWFQIAGLLVGLIICYLFGTCWFMHVYTKNAEPIGFASALGMCVIPFVIPDLIKMSLAFIVSKKIRKAIGNV